MPNLNHCQFIGHLGRDPEVRYMPNGDAACNFSIAVTRKWKSKDGEKKEDTQWVSISVFGRRAEVAGKYLKKGAPVYVSGWMRTRKWQDKDGNDRYTTEIVAEDFQFLSSNQERSEKPAERQADVPVADDDDIPFD